MQTGCLADIFSKVNSEDLFQGKEPMVFDKNCLNLWNNSVIYYIGGS